jgi:hypothetical protein
MFHGKWLIQHDPEKYAIENYEKAAEQVLNGMPFNDTNHIPG